MPTLGLPHNTHVQYLFELCIKGTAHTISFSEHQNSSTTPVPQLTGHNFIKINIKVPRGVWGCGQTQMFIILIWKQ